MELYIKADKHTARAMLKKYGVTDFHFISTCKRTGFSRFECQDSTANKLAITDWYEESHRVKPLESGGLVFYQEV